MKHFCLFADRSDVLTSGQWPHTVNEWCA